MNYKSRKIKAVVLGEGRKHAEKVTHRYLLIEAPGWAQESTPII